MPSFLSAAKILLADLPRGSAAGSADFDNQVLVLQF